MGGDSVPFPPSGSPHSPGMGRGEGVGPEHSLPGEPWRPHGGAAFPGPSWPEKQRWHGPLALLCMVTATGSQLSLLDDHPAAAYVSQRTVLEMGEGIPGAALN